MGVFVCMYYTYLEMGGSKGSREGVYTMGKSGNTLGRSSGICICTSSIFQRGIYFTYSDIQSLKAML